MADTAEMAECEDQQVTSAPTGQAVPASLRQFATQIKEADEFGVAPDLVRDADELVEAAWSGALSEPVVGKKIRLADAIQRSSTVLDAASRAYIRSYTAEMRALAGNAFQATEFTEDTLKSFKVITIASCHLLQCLMLLNLTAHPIISPSFHPTEPERFRFYGAWNNSLQSYS
jgi:hypothetical protein